jgi:hypothetical protein
MIGHIAVGEPAEIPAAQFQPEAAELGEDVGVPVAVDGVAGPGLDAEAEGGGPLADPGENILWFSGFFPSLPHYHILYIHVVVAMVWFEEGGCVTRPPRLM